MKYFLILLFFAPYFIFSLSSDCILLPKKFNTDPFIIQNRKWKIGYFEEGDSILNRYHLIQTVKKLIELGWIEKSEIPSAENITSHELWCYLCDCIKSGYIEFNSDEFYSADWNPNKRQLISREVSERLQNSKDIDLLIGMGAGVGYDLAPSYFDIPVAIFSVDSKKSITVLERIEESENHSIYVHTHPSRKDRSFSLGSVFRYFFFVSTPKKIEKLGEESTISALLPSETDRLKKRIASAYRYLKKRLENSQSLHSKSESFIINIAGASICDEETDWYSKEKKPEKESEGAMLHSSCDHVNYYRYAESIVSIFNGAVPYELNQRDALFMPLAPSEEREDRGAISLY